MNKAYKNYRQSKSNAKGNNTSKKETKDFYYKNQWQQKHGHHKTGMGLAQLGGNNGSYLDKKLKISTGLELSGYQNNP